MADRGLRKTMTGVVVSNKMDKTIVVAVVDSVKHPLLKDYEEDLQTESSR